MISISDMQLLGIDGVRSRIGELKEKLGASDPVAGFSQAVSGAMSGMGPLSGELKPFPIGPGGAATRPIEPDDALRSMIRDAALQNGVDENLFESLVAAESSFDPNARSRAGAMGLTQLMPSTAKSLGISDPFDPAQNLNGGAKYLASMLQRFGRADLALAAYNAGPGKVEEYGGIPPYKETQAYVDRIMKLYKEKSR